MTKEEVLKEKFQKSPDGKYNPVHEAMDEHAKWQSIDFGRWLYKNSWHYNEELDFFYQFNDKTYKERKELGSTLYEMFLKENNHE
jgi:hypothetical protein